MGSLLTTTRLAELAGVHQTTILKAIQAGRITATTTPGGHFRVSPQAAAEFLESMGIDAGALTRRRVQIVSFADGPVQDAVQAAVTRDGRFEVTRAGDLLELGVLIERVGPEIVVLDARDGWQSMLRTLREHDARVLVVGAASADSFEVDAWLAVPFSIEELLVQLRELAEGTRVWKQVAKLGA